LKLNPKLAIYQLLGLVIWVKVNKLGLGF
jgi:hypothetical protein